MGRRKKTIIVEEPDSDINENELPDNLQGESSEEKSEQSQEEKDRLNEFSQLFAGTQAKILIQKKNAETLEWEWVDRVPLEGFEPFTLSRKYGTGRYRCRLFSGEGKFIKGGVFEYSFAAIPKELEPKSNDNDKETFFQVLLEQQKQTTMMLVEILKTALGSDGGPKSDINSLVGALKSLYDMNPQASNQKENYFKQMAEMLDLQIKFKEAMDTNPDGGSAGASGFFSEIKDALKLLMESKTIPIQTPRMPPPRPIPVVKVPEPKEAPSPMANLQPPWLQRLLTYVPIFANAAKDNLSVDKWAAFLVDILDTQTVPDLVAQYNNFVSEDDIWDRLIEAATDDEKVEKIYTYAPDLQVHRDWVYHVLQNAVKLVSDENSDSDSAEPAKISVNGTNGATVLETSEND